MYVSAPLQRPGDGLGGGLLVLAVGLYLWFGTGDKYSMPIDMLELNTKCDEISDRLSAGESVDALENEYDCEITLLTDDNYESVNNYFIKEGLSVFDYREEGVIKGKKKGTCYVYAYVQNGICKIVKVKVN